MAAAPNKNIVMVKVIFLPNPDIEFKSVVPVVYNIAPAHKNNNPLKTAWFIIWYNAPAIAKSWILPVHIIATPNALTI